MCNALEGAPVEFRLTSAYLGVRCLHFFSQVRDLLLPSSEDDPWGVLAACQRTRAASSTAFSMLAKACTSVHQLIYAPQQGYPYKLFGILVDKSLADRIVLDPACLHDHFTSCFLEVFPSAAALKSDLAVQILTAIAISLRLDTMRIECKHASIRRVKVLCSQTHSQSLEQTSAHFVLSQQRLLEARHRNIWNSKSGSLVCSDNSSPDGVKCGRRHHPLPCRSRKRPHHQTQLANPSAGQPHSSIGMKRKGSITPWHAFLSNKFRKTGLAKSAVVCEEYRRIQATNGHAWKELQELCELGNQALQQGDHSFGTTARKPRVPLLPLQDVVGDVNSVYAMVPFESEASALKAHGSQLALLRQERRAKVSADHAAKEPCIAKLQAWVANKNSSDVSLAQFPRELLQPAPTNSAVLHIAWSCPAISMARLVLAGTDSSLVSKLQQEWTRLHAVHTTADAEPIGKVPSMETKCYKVGMCICSDSSAKLRAIVHQWQLVARGALDKKGAVRELYNQGAALMQIESSATTLWFCLGSLNLTSLEGSLMLLELLDDPLTQRLAQVAGAVALQLMTDSETVGCMSLYILPFRP